MVWRARVDSSARPFSRWSGGACGLQGTSEAVPFLASATERALSRDDGDEDASVRAGAVELAEKHVLPGSERESSVDDRNRLGGADDRRLDVRRRVVVDAIVQPTV